MRRACDPRDRAPARLATAIAAGLAGTAQGAEELLQAVAAGKASPQLLLERPVQVKERALFLMAIADTSASHVAAHLREVDQPGGAVLGKVQLFGRAAVLLKGRLPGTHLGLKDLRFTAHVDTAREVWG